MNSSCLNYTTTFGHLSLCDCLVKMLCQLLTFITIQDCQQNWLPTVPLGQYFAMGTSKCVRNVRNIYQLGALGPHLPTRLYEHQHTLRNHIF